MERHPMKLTSKTKFVKQVFPLMAVKDIQISLNGKSGESYILKDKLLYSSK